MGIFIPLVIALLALFLIKFAWEDWRMLRGDGIAVAAQVADHASRLTTTSSTDSDGVVTMWAAVYRFTAPDGTAHTVTDTLWSGNQGAVSPIGTAVRLHYLPGAPHTATRRSFARRFFAYAAVLGMMGALTYVWYNPNLL